MSESRPTLRSLLNKGKWWEIATAVGLLLGGLATIGHVLGGLSGFYDAFKVASELGSHTATHEILPAKTEEPANIPPLSLVVLPLRTDTNDPNSQIFAEGIANDLTQYLGRLEGAFVIAQGTAQSFTGKAVDVRQIRSDLKVRYVIQGGVRQIGETVRIDVQLASTENGSLLWSDTYQRELSLLPEVQAEITNSIARRLNVALLDAASKSDVVTSNDSTMLSIKGWATLNRSLNETNTRAAEEFFVKAVSIDGSSIRALTGLALARVRLIINLWSRNRANDMTSADEYVRKALSLAPDNADAHFVKGYLHRVRNELPQALSETQAALRLNPSLVYAYGQLAQLYTRVGEFAKSIEPVDAALRLSPMDQNRNIWLFIQGAAFLYLSDFKNAAATLNASAQAGPDYNHVYAFQAAAAMGQGDRPAAELAIRNLRRLTPNYSIKTFRTYAQAAEPRYAEAVERTASLLYKAGLSED